MPPDCKPRRVVIDLTSAPPRNARKQIEFLRLSGGIRGALKQGERIKSGAAAVSEAMYLDSAFTKWFSSEICRCTGVYR
jgi:hypothetical protein